MIHNNVQLHTLLWGGILSVVIYLLACKKDVGVTSLPPNSDTTDVDTVIVTPPANTDPISRMVLFENNTNAIKQFRIPGFIKTSKGTLLAICDARINKEADLPNKINIVLRRSTDDGRTWGNMQTVVEFPGGGGASNPALLMDKIKNIIWLFFNYGIEGIGYANSQTGYGDSTIRVMAIKSSDDGLTWSKPIDITRSVKDKEWSFVFSSPGHGIQLKDGTLLQLAYYGLPSSVTWKMTTFAFYSKDYGKTWKRTAKIGEGEGLVEGMAVQLENGEVMVNMRNQSRKPNRGTRRAVSVSSDIEGHWSAIRYDTALVEPSCQASILKLEYGEAAGKDWLVFSNPAHPIDRKNLLLRLSKDGGRSWSSTLQLWPAAAMYSDMVELQNGDLGIIYEKFTFGSLCIEFARVPRQLLIK